MDIDKTLKQIEKAEQIDLEVKALEGNQEVGDTVVEVNGTPFFVENLYELEVHQISKVEERATVYGNNANYLVACNYIAPKAKALLKDKGINYVDQAGNIFLRQPAGLIYIEGKPNKRFKAVRKGKALTKAAAKLLFVILVDPAGINQTYRDLAKKADCAIGTVTNAINLLKNRKYVITLPNQQLKLVNREALIDEWIMTVNHKLLPSLEIGRFDYRKEANWKDLQIDGNRHYQWGGEVAATQLVGGLVPQSVTIFTTANYMDVIKTHRIIPDPDGPITLYKKFWDVEEQTSACVHPLLTYAELLDSDDSRLHEIAHQIKTQYLGEII